MIGLFILHPEQKALAGATLHWRTLISWVLLRLALLL
jgi:hypothetical protein